MPPVPPNYIEVMPMDHNTNITGGKWPMLSVQSDPIINLSMYYVVESDIVSLDSTTSHLLYL